MPIPVNEIVLGVYLGLLAGIFPAFVAFSLGFGFKYFTSVTIPGLGVVALSGAIAGVSGGLMGLLEPQVAESFIGITAILVILMLCLWAHAIGDTLGAKTPRRLTLRNLKESRLSADLVERVDSYGQLRVRPVGDVHDIEGYPPLPQDLHDKIKARFWKFPAGLPLEELERRLEAQLLEEFELTDVVVSIDRRGRAEIAAAPTAAGLSRRVPPGRRAVSIETLLPTGLARGDEVAVHLPDGTVRGQVLSARTKGAPVPSAEAPDENVDEHQPANEDEAPPPPKAPTTTGGEGRVTVALSPEEAVDVLRHEFAPVTVHSRGKQREYETVALLKQGGNRFRKLVLGEGSPIVGQSIGTAKIRDTYGSIILSIRRGNELLIAPRGSVMLSAGDQLIVAGKRGDLRRFSEVAA